MQEERNAIDAGDHEPLEDLQELVKKSAEVNGSTLEGILQELKDFREEWRLKGGDTNRRLANHERRIMSVERRLSNR